MRLPYNLEAIRAASERRDYSAVCPRTITRFRASSAHELPQP
jgi:hypothetical protein